MADEHPAFQEATIVARFAAIVDCVETYLATAYRTLEAINVTKHQDKSGIHAIVHDLEAAWRECATTVDKNITEIRQLLGE